MAFAVMAAMFAVGTLPTVPAPQAGHPPAPTVETPRSYQRDGDRTDIFAALAARDRAVSRLPPTDAARRAAMVDAIRRNVALSGATFDMGELEAVLHSMSAVPREAFVAKDVREYAYVPFPLPIGHGQTISDAYIVAVMTAAIRPRAGQRILDVGTGSGYQAAVVAGLVESVTSIEIVAPLARAAKRRLRRLGYRNVDVVAGDGFGGVPAQAPFDGIIVAAGAKAVPAPLLDQLKPGGRLVMPIGPTTFAEQLLLFTKRADGSVERCSLGPAAFVPFTGRAETLSAAPASDVALCYGRPVT